MATRFIDVTFDNGETYTYEGVPFDATPEQAQARIAQDFPDLLVTSIDGSRTSEGVAPQAPVQPASTPSIVEAARTSQTPVAAPVQALGEGERVVFGDDVVGGNEVAIQQLNPETKAAIEAELATYAGNPEFSSDTVNQVYSKYGVGAGPTDEKYVQAMREGRQVGGIPVGEYEAQQKRLEDEAIAAQATEMAKGLEGQGLFSREFEEATLYGFPGWLGNIANDWLDTGKEELRRMYPGESEDWYEEASEKIVTMTQRSLRQAYEQESERNPAWKPDEGMISNIASFRWFPAVAGSLLGSVGPESFLAPGASAAARIGSQAAISGAAELAYETGDYAMGVNDGISGENILAATALGGVFQGGMEGLGRILRGQRSGKDIEAEVEAGPQPTGEVSPIVEEIVSPSRGPMPTEQMEMDFSFEPRQMEMDFNAPDLEGRLAQEAADFRMRNTQQEPTPETLFAPREEQLEMPLEAQPDLFRGQLERQEAPAAPVERVIDDLDTKVEDLQRSVDYQMEDWKNAPDTFVIRDYDDLADPAVAARLKQADPEGTAKGVTLEDGSVAIIGKNIEGPEEVRAVLFHEALGHYGASQYFGNALNKNLEAFYNNSPSFKEKVDEWMEANPGAYADRPDTIARAADEVLAEMSEGGKIDVKLMDRLKNVVKATLRRIGLKDVEYSEREIMTILGMMHDAVVKGTSVADNGFKTGPRFSAGTESPAFKSWFKGSKVVNSSGKPLEVYHGSGADISQFKGRPDERTAATKILQKMGMGFDRDIVKGSKDLEQGATWFTSSPELASSYAVAGRSSESSPNVTPVFLSMKKPVILDTDSGLLTLPNGKTVDYSGLFREGDTASAYAKNWNVVNTIALSAARKYKADGAILRGVKDGVDADSSKIITDTFITFSPSQIKSSRGNTGAFDPNNPDIRFSNSTREKKSLTPEKMKTKNDIDDLLEFVGKDAVSAGPISDVELGRMADDLGLTSSKYLKGKSIADSQVAARLRGAHQVITNTVDELGGLRERVEAEGMSPTLQASIRQKLGTLQALYARFDEDTAEVGRALRALRLVSESRQSSKAMDRFLRESDGLNLASDEASFLRFMNHMEAAKVDGGAEAAGKFFNNARKMHWEDYAGSYIFNNMLSSPRTWAVNAGGGLMNHFIESFSLAGQALIGSGRRALDSTAETTHVNELIAQQMGALAGLWNYRTMADTVEAFKRGEASGGSFSSKVGQSGTPLSSSSNKAVKAAGYALENTRRIMAATDEVWSAMFRMSELFRLAAHEVSNREDFKGNYWDEVKALAKDPSAEMLQKSNDYASKMLFRDKASVPTEGLAKMQRPRYEDEVDVKMRQDEDGKWVPYARTVTGKDSQAIRVGKFGLRLMVPFAHTLDRIAATMLRNSGPLAVLTPTIRKQLKAGGVEREAALGRIVATSAMLSYFGFMTANGDITGATEPDYKKAFSLSAVTPANSIRLGDEWMSYQGWDPLAGMMSAVSTAYERSDGKLSAETAAGLVSGFAEAMMKSTYAESLANSMEVFQEVTKGLTSGEMDKKQATANFLAGQTANLVPAASFVRWMNQNFIDPNSRATKGDGSVADRMTNRLKVGIPFLSDDLPAKYDIFGRPVQNPRQERLVETDPVIKAVHEVDRNTKDIIFGAVSDRVKKDGVPQTKLTAEEHQRYQETTGLFFYEDASADINDPLWNELTPEEKQEQLAYRYEEAKKYAREYLFPEPEEVEEEDYVE